MTTPLSCHPAVLHLYRSHGYHKGYIQVLSGLLKNQTDLSAEIYIPQSDPSSAPLEMVMYTEAVGVICSIGNLTLLDEYGTYIGNVSMIAYTMLLMYLIDTVISAYLGTLIIRTMQLLLVQLYVKDTWRRYCCGNCSSVAGGHNQLSWVRFPAIASFVFLPPIDV